MKTHGKRGSGAPKDPTYNSWRAMRQRCYNTNHVSYKNYEHVAVCPRWLNSTTGFEAFLADMGPKPSKKHQVDRIDPYGDYEPDNCRWALPGEGMTRKQADEAREVYFDF